MPTLEQVQQVAWLGRLYGIKIPVHPVCREHQSPGMMVAQLLHDRPMQTLWQGPRGGGKAQPLDSHVQTPYGPVRIGDVEVGDEVCTPDGGSTTVVAVHPQGRKPVYRIGFGDGDSVRCCWDHLWEVSSPALDWKHPKVVTTEYLFCNYLSPSRCDNYFSIRLPSPLEFRGYWPERLIDPYVLGVLIGDGCLRNQRITFTSADAEVVDLVRSRLAFPATVVKADAYAYGIKSGVGKQSPYQVELDRLELLGKGAHEKHIPDEYLYAPIRDRWELVRGLMDTDGHIDSRGHVSYCTTSRRLARDFKFLIESLGGICVATEKPTSHRTAYNLYIRLDDPSQLFHLSRKKVRGLPRTKYPARRMIAEMAYDGTEECRCITVASDDGLYLTDHCVVTHNSFLTGFAAYLSATIYPGFEAKILGGSFAQSQQIYEAISKIRDARPELPVVKELLKTQATFLGGQTIEILTASDKSVRGPHVPQLYIDEVDEIDPDLRESAYGMATAKPSLKSSIALTSTWHRVAGPMAPLVAALKDGRFPGGIFCAFDILERCPEERSGPKLENCPNCPIVKWCHEDRESHPEGLPKAKRSRGHYDIDAFIQKAHGVSARVFESDYLCRKPRAAGMWFAAFDESVHVTEAAEYRAGEPFHCAADPGVHTGAVWFQVRRSRDGTDADVNVFGDYFAEGKSAEENALAIVDLTGELTDLTIGHGKFSMDPAGRQRNAVGPTVVGEYKRAGCVGRYNAIEHWPEMGQGRPKADVLAIVEALLKSADGTVSLRIHPRCTRMIEALLSYRRARSSDGQFLDHPEDPQHPHEEFIDSLSGGLTLDMPQGLKPKPAGLREADARKFL